jgi:hypothetical protein
MVSDSPIRKRKLKHWQGVCGKNGLNTAPVLGFIDARGNFRQLIIIHTVELHI